MKSASKAKNKIKSKLQTRPRAKKTPKPPLEWPEITLIGILIASVVLISMALLMRMNFDPRGDAEAAMNKLTDNYYRAYLYPQLLDYKLDHPEKLETYAELGVPTTYLRQLLNFNDEKKLVSEDAFSNQYFQCDINHTGVRYYPHEPYGPHDYTVKYLWNCVDHLEPTATAKGASWTEEIKSGDN